MKEKKEYGKIIINDDYYITRLDKYCLGLFRRVERRKKDTAETYFDWEIAGYHGDINNAIYQAYRELKNDKLFDKDIELASLMQELNVQHKEIKEIIKNLKVEL